MNLPTRKMNVAMCLVAVIALGGCRTTKPVRLSRYVVNLSINQALAGPTGMLPSVEVHLVATDSVQGRILQDASMSDYWNPNRGPDDYIRHVMHFGGSHPSVQVLDDNDPIWRRWEAAGAKYLFVLADLPGVWPDQQDIKDARRVILPLDPSRWTTRVIRLSLDPDGVHHVSKMLPAGAQ